MTEKESSHFKVIADDVKPDATLKEERGWHKMDVRWLVTGKNMDSKQTVVGRTIMPPGVKSRHAIHRHPNAEEWEYIISGVARKHCGTKRSFCGPESSHSFRATSTMDWRTPPIRRLLVTLWGYCGASSLEEAGYVIPEDGKD